MPLYEYKCPNGHLFDVIHKMQEPGPEKCHRRLVAEMLARHWNALGHDYEVSHLVIERPVRTRKKRAGAGP